MTDAIIAMNDTTETTGAWPRNSRMTDAEYEAERAKLTATYGESRTEAIAKCEQAFAVLFYRSGWTQEELARKEGKSAAWINYRLRFGRFLSFFTSVKNADLPPNLTETHFRKFWERTDKKEMNERIRFRAVVALLKEQTPMAPRRPMVGKQIKDRFADGKWHSQEHMVAKLGIDEGHVRDTLEGFRKNQNYGCRAEYKKVGTKPHWRIFKLDKTVSSTELSEKLTPIIEALKTEGRKTMVTMVPAVVAKLAVQLERFLDEWTE